MGLRKNAEGYLCVLSSGGDVIGTSDKSGGEVIGASVESSRGSSFES